MTPDASNLWIARKAQATKPAPARSPFLDFDYAGIEKALLFGYRYGQPGKSFAASLSGRLSGTDGLAHYFPRRDGGFTRLILHTNGTTTREE